MHGTTYGSGVEVNLTHTERDVQKRFRHGLELIAYHEPLGGDEVAEAFRRAEVFRCIARETLGWEHFDPPEVRE